METLEVREVSLESEMRCKGWCHSKNDTRCKGWCHDSPTEAYSANIPDVEYFE